MFGAKSKKNLGLIEIELLACLALCKKSHDSPLTRGKERGKLRSKVKYGSLCNDFRRIWFDSKHSLIRIKYLSKQSPIDPNKIL